MNNYRSYEDIIKVDNYDLCEALECLDECFEEVLIMDEEEEEEC